MWRACQSAFGAQVSNVKYYPSTVIYRGGDVYGCDISSDGTKIVSTKFGTSTRNQYATSSMADACVHNSDTGAILCEFTGQDRRVSACAIDSNGQSCVTGDQSGGLFRKSALTGQVMASFPGHTAAVTGVAISLSGEKIASSSDDKTARVWDSSGQSGRLSSSFAHHDWVTGVDISSDARLVYTSCNDGIVRGWDLASGSLALVLRGHTMSVLDCACTYNGTFVVSCSGDGTVRVWDVRKQREVIRKDIGGCVRGCDMAPDGRRVVACTSAGKVFVLDTDYPQKMARLMGTNCDVFQCAISETGSRVVTGCADERVRIFKVPSAIASPMPGCREVSDSHRHGLRTDHAQYSDNLNSNENNTIEKLYNLALEIGPSFNARGDSVLSSAGCLLTTKTFVDALRDKSGESNVLSILDAFRAHVILRTMLYFGLRFSDDELQGPSGPSSFFYDTIYVKLCSFVESMQEKDLAGRILCDAAHNSIITNADKNSILVGIQVMRETKSQFRNLENIIAEMHRSITCRLNIIESAMKYLESALYELRLEDDRRRRIALISGWVKLGLSLIPIAGPVAMSIAGVTGDILFSFSAKDIVEICAGVGAGATDVIVAGMESRERNEPHGRRTRTKGKSNIIEADRAIHLVEVALSENFLEKLSTTDRQKMTTAFTRYYKMSLREMRNEAHAARRLLSQCQFDSEELVHVLGKDNSLFHDSRSNLPGTAAQEDNIAKARQAEKPHFKNENVICGERTLIDNKRMKHNCLLNAVRNLTVFQVSALLADFVCAPLSNERAANMRTVIRRNVIDKAVSGRSLISKSRSPEFISRRVLYHDGADTSMLEDDFIFLDLVDFIVKLREGDLNDMPSMLCLPKDQTLDCYPKTRSLAVEPAVSNLENRSRFSLPLSLETNLYRRKKFQKL